METRTQQFQLQELYDMRRGMNHASIYWLEKARREDGYTEEHCISMSVFFSNLWKRIDVEIKAQREGN